MLAIGGMPDHIHIFTGFKPAESISDLVREIKNASQDFIKAERLSPFAFNWQNGYGVFSHSRPQLHTVCQYILNQKEHHRNKTFQQEFLKLCDDAGVEPGRKQMFEFFE